MAMVYDLPTADMQVGGTPQYTAPDSKNYAAEQQIQQGAAVVKAGGVMTDIQDHIDDAATKEADNLVTDAITNVLVTGENPYLGTTGKDAVTNAATAAAALQEAVKKTESTLTNDTQRIMFKGVATKRLQHAALQIGQHKIQQGKQYDLEETEKRALVNEKAALAQWGTWKMADSPFATAKQVMVDSVEDALRKRGIPLDSAQAQEALQTKTTELHTNIIGQMLTAQKSGEAKEYYDKFQSEIDPRRWDDIGKVLKQTTADQEGITTSFAMKARLMKGEDPNVLMEEAFKSFGGGTEALRADSFKVFQAQFTKDRHDVELGWTENAERLSGPINKAILEKETKLNRRISPAELATIPTFTEMRLSSNPKAVKEANRIYDEVMREHTAEVRFNKSLNAGNKAERKAELDTRSAITVAEYARNPRSLAKLTPEQRDAVLVSLTPSYRTKFEGLVKNTTSPEAVAKIEMAQTEIGGLLKSIGWTNKDKIAKATVAATTYLIDRQKKDSYHYTKDEARAAVAAAVTEVEVNAVGGFNPFSSTMKIPYMQVKNRSNIRIPKEDEATILSDLKNAGVHSPSKADVLDAYEGLIAERALKGAK